MIPATDGAEVLILFSERPLNLNGLLVTPLHSSGRSAWGERGGCVGAGGQGARASGGVGASGQGGCELWVARDVPIAERDDGARVCLAPGDITVLSASPRVLLVAEGSVDARL